MTLLPPDAAPGVADLSEALAEAACALGDAAGAWNATAAENAIEAMEIIAAALAAAHPSAIDGVSVIGRDLGRLRQDLGLPARDDGVSGVPAAPQAADAVTVPIPLRSRRRRGLGPGFQGIRIPQGDNTAG